MHHDQPESHEAIEELIATLRKLSGKWWGQTVEDVKHQWRKHQGKWVAFECYYGCISVRKDPKRALREARKLGFCEPHLYLYDVSSDKVYLPNGKEYDPATDDLHTEEDRGLRLTN